MRSIFSRAKKNRTNFNDLITNILFEDKESDDGILLPVWRQHSNRTSGNVSCYFEDLEEELIRKIEYADAIIGCVAWLTNFNIIEAIAQKPASLLIQKEDFLRLDSDVSRRDLRSAYEEIQYSIFEKQILDSDGDSNVLFEVSDIGEREKLDEHSDRQIIKFTGDSNEALENIRCVGNVRTGKAQAESLMHHKFLVFLSVTEVENNRSGYSGIGYYPYAVWTGSLNLTINGMNSFENAVYIKDEEIAYFYAQEFAHVYRFSDSLDWESPTMPKEVLMREEI